MPPAFVEKTCLPYLVSAQNENGGWGFHAGSVSRAEPTAWALLALLEFDTEKVREEAAYRAFHFLETTQLPDGSWPSSPEQSEGSWPTSLACLALLRRNEFSANVRRGLDWLCKEMPGETKLLIRLIRRVMAKKKVSKQNDSYFGWSWTSGTASWVEPTSYAIILMGAVPVDLLPPAAKQRLRVGESMLCDRMCPGGGWNCGNPMVYGVPGDPQVSSTAWALLALRDHPQRPEVQKSLSWLQGISQSIRSPVSMALALIAMNAYRKPDAILADTLQTEYEKKEILWNVPQVAWAALAVSSTQNWLKPKDSANVLPAGTGI